MERRGEEVHVETEEVRAGATGGGVRYVLAISLVLALIAMSAVWIVPSLIQGETVDDSAPVTESGSTGQDNP